MVLVPQALPDQLLGDGGREIAHLTPQLVTRPSDVGLELDPRALDEAVGLGARGLDELVDRSLLGGFVAEVGSMVLDGSLDGQLARVRERLATG